MQTETAAPVVILAVHIVGNGPTESDELRTRRHRQEPAVGDREVQELRKRHAGLRSDNAAAPVHGNELVETAHVDDVLGGGKTAIAVAPAEAVSERVAMQRGGLGQLSGKIRAPETSVAVLGDARVAAPRGIGAFRHRPASQKMPANKTPVSRLIRSLMAKTTGSSFISPR